MAWTTSKKATITLFQHKIKKLTDAQVKALEMTAEAVHTDIVQEQVMPRDTGHMQNESTFVDYSQSKSGTVTIFTQTPYARRLYFHPEYNFHKVENANAQGRWLEPWISGERKDFCKEAFSKFYKKLGGV